MQGKSIKQASLLCATILLSTTVKANIPDLIDKQKYKNIWETSKAISQNKREKAQVLQTAVLKLKNDIQDNEKQASKLEQNIQKLKDSIENLKLDSEQRIKENENLKQQISSLEQQMEQLEAQLNLLASTRTTQSQQFNEQAQILNQLNSELAAIQEDLNRASYNRARVENEFLEDEQNLNRLSEQISRLQIEQRRDQQQRNTLEQDYEQVDRQLQNVITNFKAAKIQLDESVNKRDMINSQLPKNKIEVAEQRDLVAKLNTKISEIEATTVEIREKIQKLAIVITKSKSELEDQQKEVKKRQDELTGFKQQISQNNQAKKQLQNEIQQADSTISQLNSRKSQLQSTIDHKNTEIEKMKPLLFVPTTRQMALIAIAKLTEVRDAAQRELNAIPSAIEEQNRIKRDNPNKIVQLDQNTKEQEQKIDQVNQQIVIAQGQRDVIQSDLDKKENRLQNLVREKNELERPAVPLREKREIALKNIKRLDETIIAQSVELKQIEKDLPQLQNNFKRLKDRKQNLLEQHGQISNQLSIINTQLDNGRRLLNQKKNQYANVSVHLEEIRPRFNQLVRIENDIKQERDQKLIDVRAATEGVHQSEQELNQTIVKIEQIQIDLEQGQRSRTSHLNQIDKNINQVEVNKKTVIEDLAQITQNETNIHNLSVKKEELQKELELKNDETAIALAQAQDAEKLTDEKRLEYESRVNRYNLELESSQQIGANQGGPLGEIDGKKQGLLDGSSAAKLNGNYIGKLIGIEDGKERAIIRAKIAANMNGLETGRSSEDALDQGRRDGIIAGQTRAKLTAKSQETRPAYEYQRDANLSEVLENTVEMNNSGHSEIKTGVSNFYATEASYMRYQKYDTPTYRLKSTDSKEFNQQVNTSVTESERLQAQNIKSESIDKNYQTVLGKLNELKERKQSLANPLIVYTGPMSIVAPLAKLDCSNVFEHYEEFVEACKNAFKSSYTTQFKVEHKEPFSYAYNQEFNPAYIQSFNQHKDNEYKNEYQSTYSVVFEEAKDRGYEEAKNTSYAKWEQESFDNNIQREREVAISEGKSKANLFFKNNPVIRFSNDSNEKAYLIANSSRGFEQGSSFSLGLNMANYGLQESHPGDVKISWQVKSANVNPFNREKFLTKIPAKTNARINNVLQGQISNQARPGDSLELSVTAHYPGDEYNSAFTEQFDVSATVVENPSAEIRVNFDENPRWWHIGGWDFWRKKPTTNDFVVTVSPQYSYLASNYQVKLSIIEGNEYAKVLESIKVLPTMSNAGESINANFQYQFKKEAEEKELKFQVEVIYQNEVVKSQTYKVITK